MRDDVYDDVPATLAVALTVWAGAVAAGTRAGIFLRLETEAYAALVVFAIAFAASVVTVDARVRAWLDRHGPLAARVALAGMSALLVSAGIAFASPRVESLAAAPWAPLLVFGVPVTLASAIAAVRAAVSKTALAKPPASTARPPRPASPSGSRTSARSAAAVRARAAG